MLTVHLQDHQTHSSTALNLNLYIKAEVTIKTNCFQKANNNMVGAISPPTPGGSRTTTSSYGVYIIDTLNMHPIKVYCGL